MLTSAEMRKLERYAISRGITPLELMENAGKQVFVSIRERFNLDNSHIIIFAGQGNNGGDGFVAARHFSTCCHTAVLFFGSKEKLSEEALEEYERIQKKVTIIPITKPEDLDTFRFQPTLKYIFIDALYGMGIKETIKESFAIDYFNQQKGVKVAVDLPSGLNPDTGEAQKICQVDYIITFHDFKKGLEKYQDKTQVVDIGIPKKE